MSGVREVACERLRHFDLPGLADLTLTDRTRRGVEGDPEPSGSRPPRGRPLRGGIWALDMLRAHLGEDWVGRAVELGDGDFPLALHLLSSHAQALAEALEWALRLDMCHDWDGSADFLRDLINDPRPSRILHSRAQLAQAAFAEYLGWPVVLEPGGDGGGPPADLAFEAPSGSLVTEIKVLMQSRIGRCQREIARHDGLAVLVGARAQRLDRRRAR